MSRPLVVAVTGASGAIYAHRLLQVLVRLGRDVHLTISPSATLVFREELGLTLNLDRFDLAALRLDETLLPPLAMAGGATPSANGERPQHGSAASSLDSTAPAGRIHYHHHSNFMASIASGSFLTDGMVICPCSGGTLGAIVHSSGHNLIHRAADVHLKERRKLIVVPRETPLSIVQLDNMKRACEVGAIVLPAMPGWYHGVRSMLDLVDFVVARILDQLSIEHHLLRRWGA